MVEGHIQPVATWPDRSKKNEYSNLTLLPLSLLQVPSIGQAQCKARGRVFVFVLIYLLWLISIILFGHKAWWKRVRSKFREISKKLLTEVRDWETTF